MLEVMNVRGMVLNWRRSGRIEYNKTKSSGCPPWRVRKNKSIVTLQSNTKAIGDRLHHFEPRSSSEDDTSTGTFSPS
ncbi:hypothetical protein TNCV_4428391 [Trichonephila clavipes]|nr:hypothetical protein TNCV_4428391 [Trichonephila clavipes]